MKKRKITPFIVLLLVLAMVSGALAESVIIPVRRIPEDSLAFAREEALARAADLFSGQNSAYRAENYRQDAKSVLLPDGQAAWIVTMERCVEEPVGNIYAVFSADNGEIIELYYPDNDIYTWILMEWISAKRLHRQDWSVEDQALFDWLFAGSDSMFEPSHARVPSDEAVRVAAKWLLETFGAGYDETRISYSGNTDGSGNTSYCWVISFIRNGKQAYIVSVSTETGEIDNCFSMDEGSN